MCRFDFVLLVYGSGFLCVFSFRISHGSPFLSGSFSLSAN
jgi:hypothetical protein